MTNFLLDYIMAATKDPNRLVVGNKESRVKISEALKNKIIKSRRYFVDEEVTIAASTMGVDHPESLLQILRRARIPTKVQTIYVEWFNRVAIEANDEKAHPNAPEKIGCFIESLNDTEPFYRITIVGVVGEHDDPRLKNNAVMISPVSYLFRTDEYPTKSPDLPYIINATGFDEEWLQKACVGTAYVNSYRKLIEDMASNNMKLGRDRVDGIGPHLNMAYDACKEFQKYCTVSLTPMTRNAILTMADKPLIQDYLKNDIVESAGTWRFIVSLLALMNEHEYITETRGVKQKGGNPKIINGKIAPFIEHIVVGLKLPRKNVEQKLKDQFSNQETTPKRGHEVDGSWRTFKSSGLRTCDHVYEYEENSDRRMRCIHENCGKLKFWTPGYKRGNFALGQIIKTRVLQLQ
jgi:hypothetical protein